MDFHHPHLNGLSLSSSLARSFAAAADKAHLQLADFQCIYSSFHLTSILVFQVRSAVEAGANEDD
jgi:hypothetical protein